LKIGNLNSGEKKKHVIDLGNSYYLAQISHIKVDKPKNRTGNCEKKKIHRKEYRRI